jgi:GNAT superfamily N-acetyltransferase
VSSDVGEIWQPPALPFSDVRLKDGTVGIVRRVSSLDRDEVTLLHGGLALDSLRMRFFSISRIAADVYVEHVLSSCRCGRLLALGLWHRGRLAGLATAECIDRDSAEVAFVVTDSEHGLGIATLLLEHLAAEARRAGVRQFTAEVLVDNSPMLQVMKDAGYGVRWHSEGGVISMMMETGETRTSLAAADTRETVSAAASSEPPPGPEARRRSPLSTNSRHGTHS